MRVFAFIFCILVFTGCYTRTLVKNARLDYKGEQVDSLISYHTDTSGNLNIWFSKKRNNNHTYYLSIPFEYNIASYDSSKLLNFTPKNAGNLVGVFYMDRIRKVGSGSYHRLMLMDTASIVNVAPINRKQDSSRYIVQRVQQKLFLPSRALDSNYTGSKSAIQTKAIAFAVNVASHERATGMGPRTYIIALLPKRKKWTRYLLLPIAISADIITGPIQLIGIGLGWLFKDVPFS
jgi:hypothetical protein